MIPSGRVATAGAAFTGPFTTPLYFAQRLQIGLEWSLLAFGTGLLVGTRVALSIGLGTLVVWIAGPTILARDGVEIINGGIAARDIAACDRLIGAGRLTSEQTSFMNDRCGMLSDYLQGNDSSIVLLRTMWPATALIITSGLTCSGAP